VKFEINGTFYIPHLGDSLKDHLVNLSQKNSIFKQFLVINKNGCYERGWKHKIIKITITYISSTLVLVWPAALAE
jgi:hypothetical protein